MKVFVIEFPIFLRLLSYSRFLSLCYPRQSLVHSHTFSLFNATPYDQLLLICVQMHSSHYFKGYFLNCIMRAISSIVFLPSQPPNSHQFLSSQNQHHPLLPLLDPYPQKVKNHSKKPTPLPSHFYYPVFLYLPKKHKSSSTVHCYYCSDLTKPSSSIVQWICQMTPNGFTTSHRRICSILFSTDLGCPSLLKNADYIDQPDYL